MNKAVASLEIAFIASLVAFAIAWLAERLPIYAVFFLVTFFVVLVVCYLTFEALDSD